MARDRCWTEHQSGVSIGPPNIKTQRDHFRFLTTQRKPIHHKQLFFLYYYFQLFDLKRKDKSDWNVQGQVGYHTPGKGGSTDAARRDRESLLYFCLYNMRHVKRPRRHRR